MHATCSKNLFLDGDQPTKIPNIHFLNLQIHIGTHRDTWFQPGLHNRHGGGGGGTGPTDLCHEGLEVVEAVAASLKVESHNGHL